MLQECLKIIDSIQIKNNHVIIFDIDRTLIDDFGNPIKKVVYIYNYAKEKGIKTIIITARKGNLDNMAATINQLKNVGITGYERIYFLPNERHDQSLFKLLARRDVYDNGFDTIMSLGDMPWDIGHYGGHGFIINDAWL